MTYTEQLASPHWQRKRLEIMSRDGFKCTACSSPDDTLHVHHKHYTRGRMAWEYEDHELITLCKNCHADEHEQAEQWKQLLAKFRPRTKRSVYAILCGMFSAAIPGLDDEYLINPDVFVLGEIYHFLLSEQAPRMVELLELRDALSVATPERKGIALKSFIAALLVDDK